MVKIIHIVTCALLLGFTLVSQAQTRFWIGNSGDWHDSSHWSETSGGDGGASIPNAQSNVVFDSNSFSSSGEIHIAQGLTCGDLIVLSSQPLLFDFQTEEATNFNGNVRFTDDCVLDFHGPIVISAHEAVELNFGKNVLKHPLRIEGSGTIDLSGHLLTKSDLYFDIPSFDQNGFALVAGDFEFNPSGPANWNASETSLFFNGSVQVGDQIHINQHNSHAVANNEDNTTSHGGLELEFAGNRTASCGTGEGEIPFTIEAIVLTNFNGEDISCNGADDGETFVNVSGGVGPFTFQWIGGDSPGFAQTYPNLGAGTYTILVTDLGQEIICVDNVQLAEPTQITVVSFTSSPPSCEGLCNGTGMPFIIGGAPGYDFVWSTGELSQSSTMLCEGGNTLNVIDQNGCAFDSTFVMVIVPLYANIDITDVLCNGSNTGSAISNPSGGNGGPYDFDWSTGETGNSISGQLAGTYDLTVTDPEGCSIDTTFQIIEEPAIDIVIDDVQDVSCGGFNDGTISITVTGGMLAYDFAWTGPSGFNSADEDLIDLFAGDYELELTDQNNCILSISVAVDEPELLEVLLDIAHVSCPADADGSIDLNISGGAPLYDVVWTGPNAFSGTDESIINLEAGDYHFIITDENDCILEGDIAIDEPEEILADITITPVSCSSADDAAIDIEISGGTPNYDVSWVGPNAFSSTDEDISDLEPGDYDLTITDSSDCVFTTTITIDLAPPVDVQVDVTEITCAGADDGQIDLTISGGTPDYTFSWTGPNSFVSIDEDIADLEPGQYTVLVTDDAGCFIENDVVLNDPLDITILYDVTDVSCGGDTDGAINISVLGGTPDYTFSWTGPNAFTSVDEDIIDLEAGMYTVLVTDISGCQQSVDIEVMEPLELELEADVTPITCNNANNGAIDLTILGGQPQFTIVWTGPGVVVGDEDQTNLGPGIYDVNVVDFNGCSADAQIELTEPEAIDVEVITINPSCFGIDDGSIELVITGGVEPYIVLWGTGESDLIRTDLLAGSYDVNVSDDSGCSIDINGIMLVEPDEIDIITDVTNPLCGVGDTGAIDITISGGTPDYIVVWTGPDGFSSDQEDLVDLSEGTYDLLITDEAGCIAMASVEILAPETLEVTGDVTEIDCFGDLGAIDLTIVGGSEPIDILWTATSFTSTQEDITDLIAEIYAVVVTDENGCFVELEFDLSEPAELLVDATVIDLDCSGEDNGSIEITITGGVEDYNILWSGPNAFSSSEELITDLEEGDYILTVGDANGCAFDGLYTISQPQLIDALAIVSNPLCENENTGSIELDVSGGVPDYDFIWSGPAAFSSTAEDVFNLDPGTYDVTISDQGGCAADLSFEIEATSGLQIDAVVSDLSCSGLMDGAIDLTVSGATPDYQYSWEGPAAFSSTDEDLTDLEPGIYTVTVVDANFCEETGDFEVVQGEEILITLDQFSNSTCGQINGSASVIVTGGQDPVIIGWLDADLNPIGAGTSISSLPAGLYYAAAQDLNGCQEVLEVNISDEDVADLESVFESPSCNGFQNGSIQIDVTNGSDPFDFTWTGPEAFASSDEDIFGLSAGTYNLEIIDNNGCILNEIFDLTQPDELTLDADVQNISCNGENDGAIDLTVFGGTEDYVFDWQGPLGSFFSEDIQDLQQGEYTVFVNDANLCNAMLTVFIEEFTELDLDVDAAELLCYGEQTADIDITVSGGDAPYDFLWTGPNDFTSINEDLTDVGGGDYTISISDDSGCSVESTITIQENTEIVLDLEVVDPNCLQANGSITTVVSGGSAADDYFYFWYDMSNGGALVGTDAALIDLSAGDFVLEIFDDLGCSVATNISLTDLEGLIEANVQDVICNGQMNGTIDITVSGGDEPYTYDWDGPSLFSSVDEDIADLEAGTYNVTATDFLGCIFSEAIEVAEPDSIVIVFTSGNVVCSGDTTGAVLTSVSGGNPQYDYAWVGPNGYTGNTSNLQDLAAGCYDLLVTDDNLCTAQAQMCIEEPSLIELMAEITDVLCYGDTTGAIDITAQGGSEFFQYSWVGPNDFTSMDEDLSSSPAGTYDLLITDQTGCSLDTMFTIGEGNEITIATTLTLPLCVGNANGTIAAELSGGEGNLDITWTAEGFTSNDANISDLSAGWYTYLVQDEFGCLITDSLEMNEPDSLLIIGNVVPVICFEADNGGITLDIEGGTEPYSAAWIGPNDFTSDLQDIEDLAPGTYEVTITDLNLCSNTATFQIDEPVPMDVTIASLTNTSCPTSVDGAIDITVSGGWEPYSFVWSGPDGFNELTEDVDSLDAGNYSVAIQDSLGCVIEIASIPIIVLAEVIASAADDIEGCEGDGPWLATGSNEGGVDEQWTDLEGNILSTSDLLLIEPEPGVYEFIYTAIDGVCMDSDTIMITIFDAPSANAGLDQEVFFEETVTLGGYPTAEDGNELWWGPSELVQDSAAFNPATLEMLETTEFVVTVVDVNGCASSDTTLITVIPEIDIPSGFSPNGDGTNDNWAIGYISFYEQATVEVYNRWGDQLFESTGYGEPWDGTYNGNILPIGTYYYVININEPQFPEPLTGPVTILR
ncbi:MAG: gliding motility-associated-like protein [Flavobacteriales bacterium]